MQEKDAKLNVFDVPFLAKDSACSMAAKMTISREHLELKYEGVYRSILSI